jgi:hypothetical protein
MASSNPTTVHLITGGRFDATRSPTEEGHGPYRPDSSSTALLYRALRAAAEDILVTLLTQPKRSQELANEVIQLVQRLEDDSRLRREEDHSGMHGKNTSYFVRNSDGLTLRHGSCKRRC